MPSTVIVNTKATINAVTKGSDFESGSREGEGEGDCNDESTEKAQSGTSIVTVDMSKGAISG